MNKPLIRALLRDSIGQVLDNSVFRILIGFSVLLILSTFVVQFREDEVALLFGLRSWGYESILGWLPLMDNTITEDQRILAIEFFVGVFVEFLMGNIGMMMAVAATAFFVPRMLEKGAADTLFSKPVSRCTLLIARYVTGVAFVGVVAIFLVTGMYVGLNVASGYNDPGFLWNSATMTYAFALIFGVTLLVGVFTRSTVASVLLSLIFFLLNGCVHQAWLGLEQQIWWMETEIERQKQTADEEEDDGLEYAVEMEGGVKVMRGINTVVAPLHYVLPKTTDAPILAAMLRRQLTERPPEYMDEERGLEIDDLPEDFEILLDPGTSPFASHDDPAWTIVFAAERTRGERVDRIELAQRSKREIPYGSNGRTRSENSREAFEALQQDLEATGAVVTVVDDVRFDGGVRPRALQWLGHSESAIESGFLATWRFGGDFFVLRCVAPDPGTTDELESLSEELYDETSIEYGRDQVESGRWYANRFGWSSEWKYNAYFSIGSSLLFTLVVLLLSWLKLRRIDF